MPSDFFGAVWYLVTNYWQLFLYGVITTLIISLLGTLIGFVIGLGLSILKITKSRANDTLTSKIFKRLETSLVQVIFSFRGTPMMVQASLIYYGF